MYVPYTTNTQSDLLMLLMPNLTKCYAAVLKVIRSIEGYVRSDLGDHFRTISLIFGSQNKKKK